jgi:hypothetical protein
MWTRLVVEPTGKYWTSWNARAAHNLKHDVSHKRSPAATLLGVSSYEQMRAIKMAGSVNDELRTACVPILASDTPYLVVSMMVDPCPAQHVLGVTNCGVAGVAEIMDAYARLCWRRGRSEFPYGFFFVGSLDGEQYLTCAAWHHAHFAWSEELSAFFVEQEMEPNSTSTMFWGDAVVIRNHNGDSDCDRESSVMALSVLRECIPDEDDEQAVII